MEQDSSTNSNGRHSRNAVKTPDAHSCSVCSTIWCPFPPSTVQTSTVESCDPPPEETSPATGDEAGASSLTISRSSLAPAETGSSYPRKLSPPRSLPGLRLLCSRRRTKSPDHPASSYHLSNICNQAYVQDGALWRSASRRCVAASAVVTSTGCLDDSR